MLCWKLLIYPLSPLIANTLIYWIYFASQSQEYKPIWHKAYPIYCYLLCVIKQLQMSICFFLTSYKETLRRTRATKEISSIISQLICWYHYSWFGVIRMSHFHGTSSTYPQPPHDWIQLPSLLDTAFFFFFWKDFCGHKLTQYPEGHQTSEFHKYYHWREGCPHSM